MAMIAYSMAGEGRGHATRAKTIIDQLVKRQNQVAVFAPEFAFQFLSRVYASEPRVSVEEIPGLMFHYSNSRLNFLKTTRQAIKFLRKLPRLVSRLKEKLKHLSADLAITDFEPSLPRAAAQSDVPWISIDHQHFLVVSDLGDLPRELRWKAWGMSQVVKRYHSRPEKMVVSSFYFPPVKPQFESVVQSGVLLRDQVVFARIEKQGHLVCYLRRFASKRLLESLAKCGCEARIYGLGQQPDQGNLKFREISEAGFLEDLRTCRALISNAGNQLLGEALFLRKPCFVFPEDRNFEQEINARFLAESGGGEWAYLNDVDCQTISRFNDSLDQYECHVPRQRLNGNNATLQVIESFLPAEQNRTGTPTNNLVTV